MVNVTKSDNIVAFKKRKPSNTDLDKYFNRLEIVKGIFRENIALLRDVENSETLMTMGPIYFNGNSDAEFKGILNGFMSGVLKQLLEDIESDLFKDSVKNSDMPTILNHVETLIGLNHPTPITIPLLRAIYTIVIVLVDDRWLVTDVFVNHQSLRQRAFEVAMDKTGKIVDDLFYLTDDKK